MTPAALVFDLDGTLLDSRPDIATAANRLRRDYGLPPLAEATVGTMVGEGARVLVDRALAPIPPDLDRSRALARFLAHYAAVCTVATRPYDGVEELLAVASRRWPLALQWMDALPTAEQDSERWLYWRARALAGCSPGGVEGWPMSRF